MNKRAFTLLEVIIALILASVLTIGSIKVIENMQRETNRFKQQVDDDMTWLTANHHLAKNVRGSSYLEVSNRGNTLTLRGYNGDVKGIYNNDPVSHRITYSVGPNVITTFQGVNAVFSPPSAGPTGKGWKNERNIEVIINYSLPFANVLYLRCVADVKSASGPWAKLIGVKGTYCTNTNMTPILSQSGGQITGYMICGGAQGGLWLYAIDTDGNTINQPKFFGLQANTGIGGAWSIKQTFSKQSGGSPTGFIIGGVTWKEQSMGNWNSDSYILKVTTDGSYEWARNCGIPVYDDVYYSDVAAYQIFNNSGDPDGYVLFGAYQTGIGAPPPLPGYFLRKNLYYRVNNDGTLRRKRLIGMCHSFNVYNGGVPILNKDGTLNGYVMIGGTWQGWPYTPAEPKYSGLYSVKITETATFPNIAYDPYFTRTMNKQRFLEQAQRMSFRQVFDADHNPDGFITTGEINYTYPTYHESYVGLLKLKNNGDIEWTKELSSGQPYPYDSYGECVEQTFDRQYNGNPTGYILSCVIEQAAGAQVAIVKTGTTGARQWRVPYTMAYPSGRGIPVIAQNFDTGGNPDGYIMSSSTLRFKTRLAAAGCGGFYGDGMLIIKTDENGYCDKALDINGPDLVVFDPSTPQSFAYPPVDTVAVPAEYVEDPASPNNKVDYTAPVRENL